MRIGIDVRLWNESGVGRYIRNLVHELKFLDKKNEYVLFCLSKDKQEILKPLRQAQGKQVQGDRISLIVTDIKWHSITEQVWFPKILNKEKLDLVHFPYFSVPIFYNKPFVVTIHDLIINHFDTGEASTLPKTIYQLKRFGYKFIINHAINNSQKIITVSQATKKEIKDHYNVNEGKIVITYEGVDEKIQNSQFRVQNEIKKEIENYFLYVGNAYPHKNLKRLIDAFENLITQKVASDIKLILVGKEDYFYKYLKQYVNKKNLEKYVIFCGFTTDEDLFSLYKNAKALISPSLMEGFDLPVLEAMSKNCLVVLSDIDVHKEIAGNAALYFDPENIQSILDALMQVIKKSDKIDQKKKSGVEIVKKFSWTDLANKTLKVYESCHRLRPGE